MYFLSTRLARRADKFKYKAWAGFRLKEKEDAHFEGIIDKEINRAMRMYNTQDIWQFYCLSSEHYEIT